MPKGTSPLGGSELGAQILRLTRPGLPAALPCVCGGRWACGSTNLAYGTVLHGGKAWGI